MFDFVICCVLDVYKNNIKNKYGLLRPKYCDLKP